MIIWLFVTNDSVKRGEKHPHTYTKQRRTAEDAWQIDEIIDRADGKIYVRWSQMTVTVPEFMHLLLTWGYVSDPINTTDGAILDYTFVESTRRVLVDWRPTWIPEENLD